MRSFDQPLRKPIIAPLVFPKGSVSDTSSASNFARPVDHVPVPKGVTVTRPSTTPPPPPPPPPPVPPQATMQARASALDEARRLREQVLDLRKVIANQQSDRKTLEQQLALKMTTLQIRHRADLADLHSAHRHHGELQSQLSELRRKNMELSTQLAHSNDNLAKLRQELDEEKERINVEARRLAAQRHMEYTELEKARAKRKSVRETYVSFRESNRVLATKVRALFLDPELLPLEVNSLKRELVYWARAKRDLETFKATFQRADEAQYWDAGERVQKDATDPQEQADMRAKLIHQIQHRMQHRDTVVSKIQEYLQTSDQRAEHAHLTRQSELRKLQSSWDTLAASQHVHRKLLRVNRYHMDPQSHSPERGAYERNLTAIQVEFDRPIINLLRVMADRWDIWRDKKTEMKLRTPRLNDPRAPFYNAQMDALGVVMTLLQTARKFIGFEREGSSGLWPVDQPLYQQSFWRNTIPLVERHYHLESSTRSLAKTLIRSSLGRHKILSMGQQVDIRDKFRTHEQIAFEHAFVKHKKNEYTAADEQEIWRFLDKYRGRNTIEIKRSVLQLQPALRLLYDSTEQSVEARRQRHRRSLRPKVRDVDEDSESGQNSPSKEEEESPDIQTQQKSAMTRITSRKLKRMGGIPQPAASTTAEMTSTKSKASSEIDMTSQSVPATATAPEPAPQPTSAPAPEPASAPATTETPTSTPVRNTVTEIATDVSSEQTAADEISEEETKPSSGPVFKLARRILSPPLRLDPKATSIYSRIRPRVGFKPPRPKFKEVRRRSMSTQTGWDVLLETEEARLKDSNTVTQSSSLLHHIDLRKSLADSIDTTGTSLANSLEKEETKIADPDPVTELPPLLHHISSRDLRNALVASKTSQAAFWRYSLYKSLKGDRPRVFYCTTFDKAEVVAKLFSNEPVLGFDIEWEMHSKPGKSKIQDCVSLIQIACDDRIGLFQVALFTGNNKESLMPPTLRAILESPSVVKAGVNIGGDFTRLRNSLGIEGQGVFELSHLYKLVKYSEKAPEKVTRAFVSLANQVQDVLFLPLDKGNVRTSAWSRKLSWEQVEYAASDAYAGYRLFAELDRTRSGMSPTPPRPAFFELQQGITLGNGKVVALPLKKQQKSGNDKDLAAANQVPLLSLEQEQITNEDEDDDDDEAQAETGAADGHEDGNEDPASALTKAVATAVTHEAASQWLGQWESHNVPERKGKNTPSNIRAYALWHVQGLTLSQVAEAMRQPPLARTTVASYVLEAIKTEKLPHEATRVQEALDVIPAVAHRRYRGLLALTKVRSEV
jgi:hypothetical protein